MKKTKKNKTVDIYILLYITISDNNDTKPSFHLNICVVNLEFYMILETDKYI